VYMDYKNYQDNEFEQFLQDEANQHRMYPSDHTWSNIRTDLHGATTWPALTFISLLIITSLTVSTLLMQPSAERFAHKMVVPGIKTTAVTNTSNNKVNTAASNQSYFGVIEPQNITEATLEQIEENLQMAAYSQLKTNIQEAGFAEPVTAAERTERIAIKTNTLLNKKAEQAVLNLVALEPLNLNPVSVKDDAGYLSNIQPPNLLKSIAADERPIVLQDENLKNIGVAHKALSWKKLSKVGFQFYITPSRSYRTLSDAEVKDIIQPSMAASSGTQNAPMSLSYSANVNDIVRHSPATGLEIGFAALYKITGRLQFKTGFQLNVRQYYIETFKTITRDLSTVSLINNSGIQTINLLSSYNNNSGYQSEQLDNRTYQVSVPLGIQWEILKGSTMGLNAEASVQPTYSVNNTTYLLSTDFKNYADGNNFMRKWNINTSAGINFSYKSGVNLWQIGPQIRYQHLPSYTNQYPIKEHLLDYGIRLGITRQWK
jgi:hypothetical protein